MLSALPNPLPVTFGPHEADWWMVAVTALGVVASFAVAVTALITSRRAEKIAVASEDARKAEEERRDDREYLSRMNASVARLFQAIGAQFPAIAEWLAEAEDLETHNVMDRDGNVPYSPVPSMDEVSIEAQIVRMTARDEDAEVAENIAHSLVLVEGMRVFERPNALKAIVNVVREWRAGEQSAESTVAWLRDFQASHDPRK